MSMVRQGRSPRDKFFRRTEGSDTTETDGSGRYFCPRVMKERFTRCETIMSNENPGVFNFIHTMELTLALSQKHCLDTQRNSLLRASKNHK